MAAHAKDRKAHVQQGSWRADRHAARVDTAGVASVDEDSRLWNLLDHWQNVFDAAQQDIERDGVSIESAGGQIVPNPACKVMKDAGAEVRALCAILGIGPLNRARLGKGAADDDGDVLDDAGLPPARVRHG